MGKRQRLDPRQMALSFDAPARVLPSAGLLAGLDRFVAGLVSTIIHEDSRSQGEIAAAMSAVLGEPVSSQMLYAYAAEAKDNHNISAGRLLALVVATSRTDVLDALLTRIGCRVLEGDEFLVAQLGHIEAEIARLKAKQRDIKNRALPLEGRRA